MLKSRQFWIGFLIAYALSIFLPPAKLLGGIGGKKSGA